MQSQQPKPTKTLEDIFFQDIDRYNRYNYEEVAIKKIEEANNMINTQKGSIPDKDVQKYREAFRVYYYTHNMLSDAKNDFFDEAVREVHSKIKIKNNTKNILRTISKVFVQELAQACVQVMTKKQTQQLDEEVVQDAYRLLQKRRAKHNKFGKLFAGNI